MVRVKKMELIPILPNVESTIDIRTSFAIKFQFWNFLEEARLNIDLTLFTVSGDCIFVTPSQVKLCRKGLISGSCEIPGNFLNNGSYYFGFCITRDTTTVLYEDLECIPVEIQDYRSDTQYFGTWHGAVRPKFHFELNQLELQD